jgi:hypothetical protein
LQQVQSHVLHGLPEELRLKGQLAAQPPVLLQLLPAQPPK